MKKTTGTILLLFVGTVFAFLFAEGLLRIILPQNKMVTWLEMHPRGFMMNAKNLNALHQQNGRENIYRMNHIGLRGDDIHQKEDEKRILLIGDSFTFGLLMSEENTYTALLQNQSDQHFPGKNVMFLNGGVGGAGLADWPAWLDHFGGDIRPDIVLYFLNNADTDRAVSKNLYVLDEADSTLAESKRWKPRRFFINLGRQGWYRWLQKKSYFMNLAVRLAWRHLYFKDLTDNFDPDKSKVPVPSRESFYPESGYSTLLSYQIIRKMEQWCEDNNCNFVVTTTGFFDENSTEPHTKAFYESLKSTNPPFRFFDNTPCILEKSDHVPDSLRIPGDSHPDEIGAEVIAGCTWTWLEQYLQNAVFEE